MLLQAGTSERRFEGRGGRSRLGVCRLAQGVEKGVAVNGDKVLPHLRRLRPSICLLLHQLLEVPRNHLREGRCPCSRGGRRRALEQLARVPYAVACVRAEDGVLAP